MTIDPFIWRALLGGMGVAMVAGPLGCFVVWRRMAYFGDSLSHTALLGVALGAILGLGSNLGMMIVFGLFASILTIFQNQKQLPTDTVLGILAHTALSLGFISLTLLPGMRVDLIAYLFGDVLSITPQDLGWVYGGGFAILIMLFSIWPRLLSVSVNEEIARSDGISVERYRFLFLFMISAITLIAMKIVGILLISALLMIPAATARTITRSPETMAIAAAIFGLISVIGGIVISLLLDTPSGPSIVVVSTTIFGLAKILKFLTVAD